MSRVLRLCVMAAVLVTPVVVGPVLAADWEEWPELDGDFRGGFGENEPKDWSGLGETDDPMKFEVGLRYWYSMGSQSFGLEGGTMSTSDTAHTGELHLRLDDNMSRSYLKAWGGYSAAISGEYDTLSSSGDISDGEVGYAGADFGWYAFGDGNGTGIGGLVGYNYWNDSPRTERDNYTTIQSSEDIAYNEDTGVWSVGADGVERHIDINMLRLGLTGKAKLGEFFDISAEVAAIPYATLAGTLGGAGGSQDFGPNPGCDVLPPAPCAPYNFTASPLTISGQGYGAMGELMAGIHPTENLTIRFGARAWYLTGAYDVTFTGASVTPPQMQPEIDDPESDDPLDLIPPDPLYAAPTATFEEYIDTNNPFTLFRYGLLAEITYAF
jgi:hypothetical protein